MDIIQCPKCYTQNPKDSAYCNKCGANLEDTQETLSYLSPEASEQEEEIHFSPGDAFGDRYRIIEEIGRGGMGRVYKAEDRKLDTTVALKLIRLKYSADPHFIEMFKKETLTARSISHDNVIRIHDLGEAGNVQYISMEYIKGQNLKELIRTSGSLTIKKATDIAQQLCHALDAAHKKGIIHRDLKPSNIMIDNNGRVHVMDFGLAKSFVMPERLASRSIAGTVQYLSPEQVKRRKLDQRSDIYAFGLIFYEMLTGKPAFEAKDAQDYMHKHMTEIPVRPTRLNALIPPDLERLIMKCLEKKPEDRYQDANVICQYIEQMQELWHLTRPRIQKNRWWKYAAALLIILAAITFYPIIKTFINSTFLESRTGIASPPSEIGTDNPIARQFYIDAKLRIKEREWEEAIALLEKAIAADPDFAMAFKEIAMAYDYMNLPLTSKEYMKKAVSLLHKKSKREQALIRGYAAILLEKSLQHAKEIYQKLLREYPNDEEGLRMLASIYRQLEEWDEAIDQYEKVLIIDRNSHTVYDNLFYVYMARGKYHDARNILEKSQILFSNQARVYRLIAHTYICQREFDLAHKEVDKAVSLDPDNHRDLRLFGNIDHIEGNMDSAESYYTTLIKSDAPDRQILGYLWLGYLRLRQGRFQGSEDEFTQGLYIAQEKQNPTIEQDFRLALAYLNFRNGNYAAALQELNQVIDFTLANNLPLKQKRALLYRGMTYAAVNSLNYADNTADELQQLIVEKGFPKENRLVFLLRGIILFKKNRISEALDSLHQACELLPYEVFNLKDHALFYDFLADACFVSGNLEQSQIQYEKITGLTMGMLEWGDVFVRSFYRLGEIHVLKGRKAEAKQYFEIFLRRWKDADSGIVEIKQARKYLSELR